MKKLQRLFLQGDRKTFIDLIKKFEEKKYQQYPDKEDKIDEIKVKINELNKNKKNKNQITLEKYKVKGSLPKCDRVTIVSDAEHVGQKLPFCNLEINKENPNSESKKKQQKNTYPSVNFIFRFFIKKNRKNLYGIELHHGDYSTL